MNEWSPKKDYYEIQRRVVVESYDQTRPEMRRHVDEQNNNNSCVYRVHEFEKFFKKQVENIEHPRYLLHLA